MARHKRLKFYLKTTTIHGLHYVADENNNVFIRFLWMVIFVSSVVGMFTIFIAQYNSFKHNSISFVTETTYLEWNTTFPAVTLCEVGSTEIFWTPEPDEDYSPVQQFISDILFFTGSCYSCSASCETCSRLNFHEVVKRFRKDCRSIMQVCEWNGVPFECCDKFLPINTEYGICFSINSLHSTKTPKSEINMESNRATGPGELYLEVIEDIRIYFHAPEDVPFINANSDQRKDISLGEVYNVSITITEIANDPGVQRIAIDKRGCRFPWEIPKDMRVHKYYSYSSCVVQCHANAHYNLCNCTHHLMPVLSDQKYCDMEGLECLTENFDTLNRLHAKGSSKPGLVCDCIPSCVEPEYKIVSEQRSRLKGGNSKISLKLHSLPTFRFKRNVLRSTMDLVVSGGGSVGLFIGASLLNIIEAPYLLFMRQ
ncbi:hypothetical protein PPYR_01652 [Photinus pyralis]|uniref:Uncharacterized protein n=2 Tax=Photinus pyralis TaxID=7054 RepID=A0A5N4B514_PHOPY|nr:sodium channel protein Nach-like [Photinus pyralis]KAB0804682.1 hypothetical protein PPYR_01652 [Photinus pyralis]